MKAVCLVGVVPRYIYLRLLFITLINLLILILCQFTSLDIKNWLVSYHRFVSPHTHSSQPLLLFPNKSLVIWSNEMHCAPIYDVETFLKPFGVRVIDKNLGWTCGHTGRCSSLKVINQGNLIDLPESKFIEFYDAYKDDEEMKSADAFYCAHPPAVSELFELFNKPLIIQMSLRYELGRYSPDRWHKLNANLLRYASDSRNVLAANNPYDVQYFKYFTGYTPRLIRSYCDYEGVRYKPTIPGFLVPGRDIRGPDRFMKEFREECLKVSCNVTIDLTRVKLAKNYSMKALAAHRGLVYVPYQVSVMSFYEQYRMAIPIFAPSLDLLVSWHMKHFQLGERTWPGTLSGRPSGGSGIPSHPSQIHIPDPNNDFNATAVRYWFQFAEYYQFPHITYFSSMAEIVRQLQTVTQKELDRISKRMKKYNKVEKNQLIPMWTKILQNIARNSSNHPH